ncbi:MAG TPA: NrsF family protein [Polyangiaceae bacterium]|jgi:hypothetical protein|nr:NrsF family protein [Polyangiaceae bacterium]
MSDFDLDRLGDVPDPLAGFGGALEGRPLPPMPSAIAPSPTRRQVGNLRVAALLAALAYDVAWIAIMNKRDDLRTMSPVALLVEVSIPFAAAVLALLAAAAPGSRGLGEPKARLAAMSLLAPAVFVVSTVALSRVLPVVGEADAGPFWAHALRCFSWTSLYTLGPLVFAGWAFRRSFVTAPVWKMASLGVAAGAAGAATMVFVCSVGTPMHVLVGHGGPMLVGALFGIVLGRRLGQV